jgi:hypothetical protein
MSHSIARQPVASSLRMLVLRTWNDPDTRSGTVGIAGVLLVHLLLWLISPNLLRIESVGSMGFAPAAREFNIEIAPDIFAEPVPEADPSRFVETNPDAPVNEPDRTQNFGAQSQQVAQEIPTPDGRSDRPVTEGEADLESNQIVSGQLINPLEQMEAIAAIVSPPIDAAASAQRAEQNPLPGFERIDGDNPETYGSNVARIPNVTNPADEHVEGEKDVPFFQGATGMQPAIDPLRPRPRPQITRQRQVRPAILADNKFGTSNIGVNAWDARWSNYGSYLQRMIDTIQIQWERILVESRTYPPPGSMVTVKFVLNSEGRIARIIEVDSLASDSAAQACVSGITDRAPYGSWTEDMKAILGEEQEMTFTFHYR